LQEDDARAMVREAAREGMGDPTDLLTELRMNGVPTAVGISVVAGELRSIQEQQIQTTHDRLILGTIDAEEHHG
jgi:hypothetical protein